MKPFTIFDASITLSLSDVSDADHYFPSLLKPQKTRIIELIRGTAGSLILVTNETMPGFLTTYAKEVDWQIWIAQGEHPYPCRYVITSKGVDQAPQYSLQIRDWKTGAEVASDDFAFRAPTDARKVELKDLVDIDELPAHFTIGGGQ